MVSGALRAWVSLFSSRNGRLFISKRIAESDPGAACKSSAAVRIPANKLMRLDGFAMLGKRRGVAEATPVILTDRIALEVTLQGEEQSLLHCRKPRRNFRNKWPCALPLPTFV